jgi:NAD(P)-dependent dehydrogenase (short-subunit alcohol dehydrogenase family)
LQGWQVVGVSRGGSHLAGYHSLDLVEYDSQVENFVYEQPSFDLVIMTHGVQQPAEVGQLNFYRIYEEVREVNLDSVVYLTDQLIEQDKLNPGALIIYCSSIHATQPRKSRGPYAVAKAGLEALARVVAIEQADKGIRAVALRLGQMEKPMAGIVFTPEQEVAIKECTPLKWVSPDEVAALCLALYGQKSMTASVIDLDSGHSINIWPD